MDNELLLTLTTDIVAAHASNNTVNHDELPRLIQSVYGALSQAGEPVAAEPPAPAPAVSLRSSVKPDGITCLGCGKSFKTLKRHLTTDHAMTPDAYRTRWGLKADYPLVAPNYAAKRKELAVKIGLGRKPGGGRKPAAAASARGRKPKAETAEG